MRKLSFVLMTLLIASPLLARDASFNAQNFKPATGAGSYFGVYGSQTTERGKFSLGFLTDYAHEPVILERGGAKFQNLVGREISAHLTGAFGLTDWLDIELLVSAAPYIQFQPENATTTETRIRMGDVSLNGRFKLLDPSEKPIGFAVIPFVTAPTGNGASFVGNNKITGGALLSLESPRWKNRFSVALNAGYEVRAEALLARDATTVPATETRLDDLILYGVGANFGAHPKLDLIGEVRGFTEAEDIFGEQRPIELEGGVRFYPKSNWAISLGGGSGSLSGIGNPVFRVFTGLAYTPGQPHEGFTPSPKKIKIGDSDKDGLKDDVDRCPSEAGPLENNGCPPEPKVVLTPEEFRLLTRPIHFDFAKTTLRPDALPVLDILVESLKIKVEIRKISIEGHTDERGTELFNQGLSEGRAATVHDYLVEKGIEASRLTTIGYGESRPVDPAHNREAWKQNRRVEFLFQEVEGMVVPEAVPQATPATLPESGPVEVPPMPEEIHSIPPEGKSNPGN